MAKNTELLNALTSPAFASKPEEERNKALDALLKVDPTKPEQFRKAIADHKAFWNSVHPNLTDPTPGFLTRVRNALPDALVPDFVNTDDFLSPTELDNFSIIYKKAAEQRVILGLKNVDNDIITKILANNADEVRAYLATKDPQFIKAIGDITHSFAWIANEAGDPAVKPPVPAKNKSVAVLTDAAITEIRKHAVDLLLTRAIENAKTTLPLLESFNTANGKAAVDIAAKNLGFPAAANSYLTYPLNLSAGVRQLLDAKILKFKQTAAKDAFKSYTEKLTPNQLSELQVQHLLDAVTVDDFKRHLPPVISTSFNNDDMNWAKGLLGLRFLETTLPNSGSPRLLEALKARDLGTFRTEINTILNGNALNVNIDYLEHTVTPENQGTIKKALLQSLINGLEDIALLKKLDATTDLTKFKEAVAPLGVVPNDWIKDSHLQELKQSVRSRLFEKYIATVSKFGFAAHPQLLKVFASLPVAKQREVLTKPDEIRHVLNARNAEPVNHFLGTEVNAKSIVDENSRLRGIKQINNSEVAKILASIPTIRLNDNQILAINEALKPPAVQPITFTDPRIYKIWVDAVKNHCPGADNHFHNIFGLNDDGTFRAVAPGATSVPVSIQNQYRRNTVLQTAYDDPANAEHKKLLGMFLGLAKDSVDGFNALAVSNLIQHFTEATSTGEFLQHYQGAEFSNTLKKQLTAELTAELFNETKNNISKKAFADPATAPAAVNDMQGKLNSLKLSLQTIVKNGRSLAFINAISLPIHLYNPALQGKSKAQAAVMKEKYQELAADTNLVINELIRNARLLQGYLDSLPPNGPATPDSVKTLSLELEAELRGNDDALTFYKNVQNKLSGPDGILKAIEDTASGKKNYIYQTNVSYRTCLPADIGAPLPNGQAADPVVIQLATKRALNNFNLGEIPPGQVAVYDVRAGNLNGRFTEEHSPSTASVRTNKNGVVERSSSGKFELKQFPTANPQNQQEVEAENKARVDFAMTMAVQVLASMDGPPTKDKPLNIKGEDADAMGYLWTALVILGKNDPYMKFGPEALHVNSSTFNPRNEKGMIQTFSSGSYHDRYFKNEDTSIKQKMEHLAEATTEKFDPQHVKERTRVDKTVTEVTDSFKTKMQDVRAKAKQTIQEEGPAPAPGVPKAP